MFQESKAWPVRGSDNLAAIQVDPIKCKSQNSLQATNFSYIKQYPNQSGLMEYNSGVRLPLPT
jgi:hypothetical protein